MLAPYGHDSALRDSVRFFSEEQIGSEFLGPNKLDVERAGVRRTSQRCRAIDPCEYLLLGAGRLAHSAVAAGKRAME